MNKYIVLACLVLTGCATPVGQQGAEAIQAALDLPATAPVAAPPASVQQAVMDAVRDKPVAAKPAGSEPRFSLNVNNAKASEVFMGMVTGTPYSMLVHPDVSGNLTLNLKNVTVPEAMEAVRSLYGYEYEVQGKRIIVPSPAMQARVYQLNALAMLRQGKSDTRVVSGSVSLSNGGGGGGGTDSAPASASKSLETSSVQTSTDSKFWEEITNSLQTLVGEAGSVVVSPQSGIIIVKAAPANLFMVEKYLRASELISARQVMLEAKILEVELNDGFQSGINWAGLNNNGQTAVGQDGLNVGTVNGVTVSGSITNMLAGAIPGAAGSLFGVSFNDGNFGVVINLLKTQGAVHVLSSPRIATINNQKAVLRVGTDDFFVTEVTVGTAGTQTVTATPSTVTVEPFFSGVALDVTPQIDDKDNITLHVRPSVSKVVEKTKTVNLGVQGGTLVLPLASSTISETDSVVRLKDGQIVAIGGLMSQVNDDSDNRVPLLGDIPYFGQLFGNTSRANRKREMVVLIKTTLIRDSQDWNRDLNDTQRRFKTYDLPDSQPFPE
ncbi:pilus (MSHA type) biogenesis protein MshL [Thiobacillus sp.]|uniref:pilus (MSHA type) biogenesis protein MshL n=1 Tax=Thiobacillus sp. TaxID=924 RepID=UPI0025CFAE0B|nr:pilus (MSHA type) biogenesis protein MshL [Thiobacillus sp.]MBT9540404.1 secretin N-terminal domain-containing protein [Thiobacillus sp.]